MDLNTSFGPNNMSNLISQDLDESFTQHGSNNLNNLNPQNAQPQGADIEENHVTLSDLERQFRQYAKDGKLSNLKERVADYNQGQLSLDDAYVGDPYKKEAKVGNNKVRDAFVKVLSKMFGGLDKIPESVVGQMKLEDYGGLKNGANGIAKKTDEMPTSTLGKKLSKDRVATVLKNAYANVNETTTKQMFNKIKLDLGSGASRNTLVTDIKGILQSLADNERIDGDKIAQNAETLNNIAKELIASYQAPVNLLNEDGEEEIFADRRGPLAQNNEAQGFDKSKILDGAKFRNALRQLDELISSLKNEGTEPLKTSISPLAKKEGIASSYTDSGKLLSMEYSRAAKKGLNALTKLLQSEYKIISSRVSQGMAVIENRNANNKLAAIANALITGDPETKTKAINTLVALFNIGFNNLSVSKETNNLRDRFDSFIRNAFPDYIEEGTGKITSVQLEMLKKIAPAAISGKGDLAGGAGYIGIIKEGANDNVVKFLTHYGERKSDIAETLTSDEIKRVSDATNNLTDLLKSVARICGKDEKIEKILQKGTKLISAEKDGVSCTLKLLERTAVAKALAILAPLVRDSATGLRLHFDATMEKMPTKEDTTIKSVFYKNAMPKDVMDTIKRIASYAVSKSGSESGGNGYMLKTTYGTYMKMLTHSGERSAFDNPNLQLEANDKASISNASQALKDDILGLVDKLNISADRKIALKGKLESTLTLERKNGVDVLSRENVAKAITEFIKTALSEKEASAFLKKIKHAGTFENTSIGNIIIVKKYLENGGIDLIRKIKQEKNKDVAAAEKAAIKTCAYTAIDVANNTMFNKLYQDQLKQKTLNIKTVNDIPVEWKNKKIDDTSTKWAKSKFSMKKGGTTDVAYKLKGKTTTVNCADGTHAFGYCFDDVGSQEEQYVQDMNPNMLATMLAQGIAEVTKITLSNEGTIETIEVKYKGNYGTRISPSDGALFEDMDLIGEGNRKLLDGPKKYNMLSCAGMSFNFKGGSRDKFGILDNILRCLQHTIKDKDAIKMLSNENINSTETLKKINNALKFVGRLWLLFGPEGKKQREEVDKLPEALKNKVNRFNWMFTSLPASRIPSQIMAFSGKNEYFDLFGDDVNEEVDKFLDLVGHEKGTEANADATKLFKKAHENYLKHLRFTTKQWIELAKLSDSENLVIAGVGISAFGQSLVDNAEAWAEMSVLHAENLNIVFPEYEVGGTTGKIFRVAFEKYCYKHNIPIPETEPRITHSLEQADAFLKMYSWYEDQDDDVHMTLRNDLITKWNTEWAKMVNRGELSGDGMASFLDEWHMKNEINKWAGGNNDKIAIMQDNLGRWNTYYKKLQMPLSSRIKSFKTFLDCQWEEKKFNNWLSVKSNFQQVFNDLEGVTEDTLKNAWDDWVAERIQAKKTVSLSNFLNTNEIKNITSRWYDKRIENWVKSQNLQDKEAQELLKSVKKQWNDWDNDRDWKKANVMDDLRLEGELNAWKKRTDYVKTLELPEDELKFMQARVDSEWRKWQSGDNLDDGAKFDEFKKEVIDPMHQQVQWVTQNESDSTKRNDLRINVLNIWNTWRKNGKVDENTNVTETLSSWRAGNLAKENWINAKINEMKLEKEKQVPFRQRVNNFMEKWEGKQEGVTFTPDAITDALNLWHTGNNAKENWINSKIIELKLEKKKENPFRENANNFMEKWEAEQEGVTFDPEDITNALSLWHNNITSIDSWLYTNEMEAFDRNELRTMVNKRLNQWEMSHNLLEGNAIENFIGQELTPMLEKLKVLNKWIVDHQNDMKYLAEQVKTQWENWDKMGKNIDKADINETLTKWLSNMRVLTNWIEEAEKVTGINDLSYLAKEQWSTWEKNGVQIDTSKIFETMNEWLASYQDKKNWIMENEHRVTKHNELNETINNIWNTIEKASQKIITEGTKAKLDLWDKKRNERKQWVFEHEPNPSKRKKFEDQVEEFWESLNYPEFTNHNIDVKSLLDEHFPNIPVINNRP